MATIVYACNKEFTRMYSVGFVGQQWWTFPSQCLNRFVMHEEGNHYQASTSPQYAALITN